jgi:hypothetical protein
MRIIIIIIIIIMLPECNLTAMSNKSKMAAGMLSGSSKYGRFFYLKQIN